MPDSLKERLRRHDICRGTFVLMNAGGDFALFLAGLGFDFFILDLEHSMFDLARTRETILAARAAGISAIVRIPDVEYQFVSRILDAGAHGLILPRVETRLQAEKLVRFSRYPPDGERGISTFSGQTGFGRIANVPEFLQQKNEEILLIAQIETPRGVANREAILSTPGLDACFVGTGDLAMGMGFAGQPDHPEVLAQAQETLATAREHGLIVSLPIRQPADVRRWTEQGISMLTLGTDGTLFAAGAALFFEEIVPRPSHGDAQARRATRVTR